MANMFECVLASGTGNGIPLIVTCASAFAGLTITCSDGTTTLTDTCPSSSPYGVTFNLPNTGTWTVSGIISNVTYTESILVEGVDVELETTTDITVDIYSAASDTVSYTGLDGQTHTITTDSSGHASATITIDRSAGSTLTFTSSVAKDPSNLSNNYSKAITLTTATTVIYVCPDKTIYWYGYKKISMTAKAAKSATASASISTKAPTVTYNTNNMVVKNKGSASSGYVMGAVFSDETIDITNCTYAKCVAHNFVASNSTGTEGADIFSSLTNATGFTYTGSKITLANTSSSPQLFTNPIDASAGNDQYFNINSFGGQSAQSSITIDAYFVE